MQDLLSNLNTAIQKADQALSLVPKDDNLKLCAAMAKLRRLKSAREVFFELGGKKFDP